MKWNLATLSNSCKRLSAQIGNSSKWGQTWLREKSRKTQKGNCINTAHKTKKKPPQKFCYKRCRSNGKGNLKMQQIFSEVARKSCWKKCQNICDMDQSSNSEISDSFCCFFFDILKEGLRNENKFCNLPFSISHLKFETVSWQKAVVASVARSRTFVGNRSRQFVRFSDKRLWQHFQVH